MASARGMAYRREAAETRLSAALSALTDADGRSFQPPIPPTRDPLYNETLKAERLANILSTLAGIDESGLVEEVEDEPLVNELDDEDAAEEAETNSSVEPEGSDAGQGVEGEAEPETTEEPVADEEAAPAEPQAEINLDGLSRAELNQLANDMKITRPEEFRNANLLKDAIRMAAQPPEE